MAEGLCLWPLSTPGIRRPCLAGSCRLPSCWMQAWANCRQLALMLRQTPGQPGWQEWCDLPVPSCSWGTVRLGCGVLQVLGGRLQAVAKQQDTARLHAGADACPNCTWR